MKVITIKTWKRPYYYKQVLDYLAKCDGIDEYKIIHCMDGTVQAHQMMEKGHVLAPQIIGHEPIPKPFGCAGNTKRCLNLGFACFEDESASDFVLHLEDDLLPGKDWIKYMEWAAKEYYSVKDVFLITGWNRRTPPIPARQLTSEMCLVSRRATPVYEHLTYQGWGIWRDRWDEMKDDFFGIHWTFKEPSKVPMGEEFLTVVRKADDGSWGWPMKQYWRKGRKEIFPVVSRIQNIGSHNGRFNQNPEWHAANVFNGVFSNGEPAPSKYLEVDLD